MEPRHSLSSVCWAVFRSRWIFVGECFRARQRCWPAWQQFLVIATTSVTSRDLGNVYQTVGCGVVVTVAYALLHRVSPRSLGLDDVLLVVPLTLAVAHANLHLVLWWQLLAATTGAMHAVVVKRCRGRASIPFGPHPILTAWALLLVGV